MLAGVLSGLGWFKRRASRENSPTTLDSFDFATASSPIQFKVLSAAERFRNCRASVERRCKARALVEPTRPLRHATRKAAP